MNPPSAYDPPVYTPSIKEISITYHSDRPGFNLGEFLVWTVHGIYSEKLKSKKDFHPNDLCKTGQCIKSLVVIAHGCMPENSRFIMTQWGSDELYEDDTQTDISDNFKNLNFCKKCNLELRSCELGRLKQLKGRLENNTGCTVVLYENGAGVLGGI